MSCRPIYVDICFPKCIDKNCNNQCVHFPHIPTFVAISKALANEISGSPGAKQPGSTPNPILQMLSKVYRRSNSCMSRERLESMACTSNKLQIDIMDCTEASLLCITSSHLYRFCTAKQVGIQFVYVTMHCKCKGSVINGCLAGIRKTLLRSQIP